MVKMTNAPVVVFRVDASLDIGTGHIMRCLTLANELARNGAICHFLCREHPGNLLGLIRDAGHQAHTLPMIFKTNDDFPALQSLEYIDWLGGSQQNDINACARILEVIKPDWLVVDHYALDSVWEQALAPHYNKLMVIDDLADREHDCDLLLDQTFGRNLEDYEPWTPARCQHLCGAEYALLRPDFAQWRDYSLARRASGKLQHLLINLGGVDRDNITSQVLTALKACSLPQDCQITVVMGSIAPWVDQVSELCREMPWPTEIRVGVRNMAELMANSDLAIGAAGSTSWERCCLGVPSILIVQAENQESVAQGLALAGAAACITSPSRIDSELHAVIKLFLSESDNILSMSEQASLIVDGYGVGATVNAMRSLSDWK